MKDKQLHRNDIYGDLEKTNKENPLIPAATVILLRQTDSGQLEVLMLQKNTKISFGGMWVFPGGKIDPEDFVGEGRSEDDKNQAAAIAAVRETEEETGIKLEQNTFAWFAHWTPPASTPKRFSTWFFASHIEPDEDVNVDGGEITNHRWVTPQEALGHHAAGEIDLAPPTWISLYQLSQFDTASTGLAILKQKAVKYYKTKVVKANNGVRIALWHGDAGYENSDADIAGDRHRLVLAEGGFVFENNVEDY